MAEKKPVWLKKYDGFIAQDADGIWYRVQRTMFEDHKGRMFWRWTTGWTESEGLCIGTKTFDTQEQAQAHMENLMPSIPEPATDEADAA